MNKDDLDPNIVLAVKTFLDSLDLISKDMAREAKARLPDHPAYRGSCQVVTRMNSGTFRAYFVKSRQAEFPEQYGRLKLPSHFMYGDWDSDADEGGEPKHTFATRCPITTVGEFLFEIGRIFQLTVEEEQAALPLWQARGELSRIFRG